MSSAISFNLDQSKILLSGNKLNKITEVEHIFGEISRVVLLLTPVTDKFKV